MTVVAIEGDEAVCAFSLGGKLEIGMNNDPRVGILGDPPSARF
jgi:hypothetical protein